MWRKLKWGKLKAEISAFCFLLSVFGPALAQPLTRVPNTTLMNLPPSPPTYGYTYSNLFPGLVFTNPACLVAPPGETKRLFIVEKKGRIVVITNLATPTRTIFMDISSSVTSAADTSVG